MSSAEQVVVDITLVTLVIAFIACAIRIVIGPSRADRVVGTDLCLYLLVGIIGLLALRFEAVAFFDIVLVAAIVGFLSTVALTRLIDRR